MPLVYGHQMFLSSPWALTSLSQAQFWTDTTNLVRDHGDGTVRTVLSVDVSDWNTAGSNGKKAKECTVEQVAKRLGVSRRRVKRLERLIDSFIASDARRRRAARAKKKTTTRGR